MANKLSIDDHEEMEKCKADPCYFYNKYVRKNGQPELTPEQFEAHVKAVMIERNKKMRLRNPLTKYPAIPSDCWKIHTIIPPVSGESEQTKKI